MTFSLLEDKVGPEVVSTHKSYVNQRGHSPFSNQTGLSNFAMYSSMKNAPAVNKKKLMTVMTRSDLVFQ